jgi:4-amino-4-deoxy-L-arabinose transferase-like glycosyltransferase
MPRRGLTVAGIFLFSLSLLLPGVRTAYWDRDEAEYASVAHGMLVSGDFLVPRLFGRLYADKPPLAVWLTALSFRLFGESEPAGRLPHVLLASGCPALLFLIGIRLLGRRAGLRAALAMSTSLLFLVCGRLLLTDSALLFFDLASVLCLLSQGCGWWIVGGVCLGFALLAKGPIALLLPGLFVLGRVSGAGVRLRIRATGAAAFVAAAGAVGVPWFLLAARATHGESLRTFVMGENVFRFLKPMEHHSAPAAAYLAVLALGFLPWSGLLAGLLRRECWKREPVGWGLLSWGLGTLLFFSLSATKLPHYLLPALPAFALLASRGLFPRSRLERKVTVWSTAALGSLVFLAAVWGIGHAEVPGSLLAAAIPFVGIALLTLSLPLLPGWIDFPAALTWVAAAASALFVLTLPSALERARCQRDLGRQAASRRAPGETLGALKFREPALEYYAGDDRFVKWASAEEVIRAAGTSRTGSVLLWAQAADGVSLVREGRAHVEVLAQGFNLIEPGGRGLLQLLRVRAGR